MSTGEGTAPAFARGLEGVIAAATRIGHVDGEAGRLIYRGFEIGELSGRAAFEEVAHLLWAGRLPTRAELERVHSEIQAGMQVPAPALEALRKAAPHSPGMHLVRTAASLLSVGEEDCDSLDPEQNLHRAARLLGRLPALVAHGWRIRQGLEPVLQPAGGTLPAAFLSMLEEKEPSPARVEALNSYMVAVAEHGFNASTFTARVIASTKSDMVSAVTGAVGALKGPAHGGVPAPVLEMLEAIGTPDRAEAYLRRELAEGRRIMGFGHRVYKVRDPRAALLEAAAERMAALTGDRRLLELVRAVEQTTVRVLAEVKPGRDLYANVELYAALILHSVGLPPPLFTPMFAIARTAGWTAHVLEQYADNRLFRPQSAYVGPTGLRWVPLDERG